MSLPNSTPESVGVSTASQRDAALAGHGLPWMMLPGKPGAHIMIPINPPAKPSSITDVAPDEIAQATLPLPEDLRAGATVYKYDAKTGERIVLRQGTNFVECMPRGDDGFTWCYNKVSAPRRDFSAKLRAQGKSEKEIQAAVAEAVKGRHDHGDAVRHDVLPPLRQEGSDSAAVGAVRARRHSRVDRRFGGQPTRRGHCRRWAAVADVGRHAGRAHHDPDQQIAE